MPPTTDRTINATIDSMSYLRRRLMALSQHLADTAADYTHDAEDSINRHDTLREVTANPTAAKKLHADINLGIAATHDGLTAASRAASDAASALLKALNTIHEALRD